MDNYFFHASSGCDIPSSSCGKRKKSFFESWQKRPEITPTFAKLSSINCFLEEVCLLAEEEP